MIRGIKMLKIYFVNSEKSKFKKKQRICFQINLTHFTL